MNELYAECSVKRKTTSVDIILKTLLVLGVVALFLLSIVVGKMAASNLVTVGSGFVAVLAAVGLYMYWPRFHVEWEYVFCDGQLDFDGIYGGEKRKQALRIEIEEADLIAKEGSSRLHAYQDLKVLDFSSKKENTNVYVIVTKRNNNKVCIKFEPNEKMLEMMETKAPALFSKNGIVIQS